MARRSRSRDSVLAATAATLALTLGGCAAPVQITPAPGDNHQGCGTVKIARHRWVGYDANLAVVSYVLRHELHCTVVVKPEDSNDWKYLADGSVDAILESWGHDDLRKLYIDQKMVAVEAGLTGNKGVIGWYVPPWMVKKYPDIKNWKNLNKYADLFKTSKSGDKGQFLDGDPTYVTNDAALMENLGLNFKVVFTGSEDALISAFQTAENKKEPLIGYFYEPQWLLSEIPLVRIPLPPYTPGCDANPKTVECDYQPYDLDKIESRAFAYSGSPAAELIQNFQWTNPDQNEVARDLKEGKSADEAAKKWLEGHESAWRSWLPDNDNGDGTGTAASTATP